MIRLLEYHILEWKTIEEGKTYINFIPLYNISSYAAFNHNTWDELYIYMKDASPPIGRDYWDRKEYEKDLQSLHDLDLILKSYSNEASDE